MKHILLVLLTITCLAGCREEKPPKNLRIMSFNIWVGGGRSVAATADVIIKSRAQIIGIQEATRRGKNIAVQIADSLGWYAYANGNSTTIISPFAIVDTSSSGKGVKLRLNDKRFVWMFNVHLQYCPYEPYQLNGIEYCGAPLLDSAGEAVESAWKSRGETVSAVIADIKEAQKEGFPIFLTGDFNEPSYLDWTSRAVDAGLCKMPVEWPATKAFSEQAGMIDSYRAVYPDETLKPGHSWTTLPSEREVLDRIDFVFYWGDNVKPVSSCLIGEPGSLSDIGFSGYPSDHRAVLSSFQRKMINP
ncbi:MAG: endonuclease/exonuclease/phosphatase family protein [Bacteroidales bacterium]|jgi:endonuclease/exonuclease/phosphatase family metal-dependent hydrolase|nr:endonuclease/exonuclease/phosphatase family protein [Bacteroidales bacterium]